MMLVQTFLLNNSLGALHNSEHAIGFSLSGDKKKVSLNYNQIDSKESDPLACECRGLILAKKDHSEINPDEVFGNSVVVARPFNRFFNYGQGCSAKIDLQDPKTVFLEKLDGTLGIVYFDFHQNAWHVATRSVPEANLPIDGFGQYTFRTLFEKCLAETLRENVQDESSFAKLFSNFCNESLDKENTYLFEITTPLNRIVVDYKEYRVSLLGVRNTSTGKEHDPSGFLPSIPKPKTYSFGSLQEMLDFVSTLNPLEHEGFVVRDRSFQRIKVKNPGYLAYNRVRDSAMKSPRALMEIILLGKYDDVFSLLPPHIQELGNKYLEGYRKLSRYYEGVYLELLEKIAGAENPRKALALEIQQNNLWMAPLMIRYSGKCSSFQGYIESMKKEGTWGNGFLDTLIEELKKF